MAQTRQRRRWTALKNKRCKPHRLSAGNSSPNRVSLAVLVTISTHGARNVAHLQQAACLRRQ
nr:MAG TPA: hypothetical protein [Caudoviricetes sp.]